MITATDGNDSTSEQVGKLQRASAAATRRLRATIWSSDEDEPGPSTSVSARLTGRKSRSDEKLTSATAAKPKIPRKELRKREQEKLKAKLGVCPSGMTRIRTTRVPIARRDTAIPGLKSFTTEREAVDSADEMKELQDKMTGTDDELVTDDGSTTDEEKKGTISFLPSARIRIKHVPRTSSTGSVVYKTVKEIITTDEETEKGQEGDEGNVKKSITMLGSSTEEPSSSVRRPMTTSHRSKVVAVLAPGAALPLFSKKRPPANPQSPAILMPSIFGLTRPSQPPATATTPSTTAPIPSTSKGSTWLKSPTVISAPGSKQKTPMSLGSIFSTKPPSKRPANPDANGLTAIQTAVTPAAQVPPALAESKAAATKPIIATVLVEPTPQTKKPAPITKAALESFLKATYVSAPSAIPAMLPVNSSPENTTLDGKSPCDSFDTHFRKRTRTVSGTPDLELEYPEPMVIDQPAIASETNIHVAAAESATNTATAVDKSNATVVNSNDNSTDTITADLPDNEKTEPNFRPAKRQRTFSFTTSEPVTNSYSVLPKDFPTSSLLRISLPPQFDDDKEQEQQEPDPDWSILRTHFVSAWSSSVHNSETTLANLRSILALMESTPPVELSPMPQSRTNDSALSIDRKNELLHEENSLLKEELAMRELETTVLREKLNGVKCGLQAECRRLQGEQC